LQPALYDPFFYCIEILVVWLTSFIYLRVQLQDLSL
jgi:hypothetical protein